MPTIQQQRVPSSYAHALISVTAALIVGGFMAGLSPLYIGALIESFGFRESEAGLVMSVELVSLAATLTLLSRHLVRADPFRIATIGCLITIAAQVVSLLVSELTTLLCVRAVAGAGESLLTLAVSMLVSRSPAPDRFVAIAMVGAGIAFTALMAGCNIAIEHSGITGMFLVAAGTGVVLLPAFVMTGGGVQTSAHIDSPQIAATRTFASPTIVLCFVAAAICLSFVGQAAWSFAQRSGVRAGVAHADIGNWLAVSNFLSVVGSVVAALLAGRIARMPAVTLGMAATGLTNALFVGAASPWIYVAPLLANGVAFGFSTPYLFGTAAKLDSRGTVLAYANSAVMLTQALTPYIAGVLITLSSYLALATILGALSVIAIVLVVPAVRWVTRQGEPPVG